MDYDVFICHASEDKDDFVRPLAERLRLHHLEVWYDEFSLKIGDSLSQKIDEGLLRSRFGIVVLSANFFKKPWAKRELSGLISREMVEGISLILPVWHRVTVQDVMEYSPPLADKKAGSSSQGINTLVRDLINKIKPDESPLLVARDYLTKLDVDVPPISNEWWLDVVEYKEFLKYPDINSGKRWIFPLPYLNEDTGQQRGRNIASTALQLDWSFEGEELNISPITHPEIVHEFIRRWPGLYDCARENPGVLAMYVPQLTIPGFDTGFEDVFDKLLVPGNKDADMIFSYGKHDTIDNKEPLCGDIIALRHERFGNYTPEEIGHWYFDAHDNRYIRSNWNVFEGLVWLLSSNSYWLSDAFKSTFVNGIIAQHNWLRHCNSYDFIEALTLNERKNFKLNKKILYAFNYSVSQAIYNLNLQDRPENISKALIDIGLIDRYFDYSEKIKKFRDQSK